MIINEKKNKYKPSKITYKTVKINIYYKLDLAIFMIL